MKKSSRLASAMVAAMLVLPTFQNCKKGENDPFISLRSRKARVAGEWTIQKLKEEHTDSNTSTNANNSSTNSSTSNFEISVNNVTLNGTQNYSGNFGQSSSTSKGSGSVKTSIVFEKDGSFTRVLDMTNITITSTDDSGNSEVSILSIKEETSGTWNFLGNVEQDYKNKERIILNIMKEHITTTASSDGFSQSSVDNYTYSNGDHTEVWRITQLKNKEMIMEGESSGTGNYTSTYSNQGFTESSSGIHSTFGNSEMTLVQ